MTKFDFLKDKFVIAICGSYKYAGTVTEVTSEGLWIIGRSRWSKDSAGRYGNWDPLKDNSETWLPFLITVIEVEG